MSRENRMLVMFFVGMIALFTYFRVQYPNMGRVEELRPAERTPELRVSIDGKLIKRLERAIRPYEIEFGIRVFIEEFHEGSEVSPEADMLIVATGESFPTDVDVVYRIDSSYLSGTTEAAEQSEIMFGVRSVSEARQVGAVRLARYLIAEDRGALQINSTPVEGAWLDPWDEAPLPAIAVEKAAYSVFREHLERFERIEGVDLQLIVGDCTLLSRKTLGEESVDGVLAIGGKCLSDQPGEDWTPLLLPDLRPLIFSVDPEWNVLGGAGAAEIGTLNGLIPLSALLKDTSWPVQWENGVSVDTWSSFNHLDDLGKGVQQNQKMIGITLAHSTNRIAGELNPRWAEGTATVQLLVAEGSRFRHLLARLSRVLSEQEFTALAR